MLKVKEFRSINPEMFDLLCDEKGWYRKGSRQEYLHVLHFIEERAADEITTEDIYKIALDIVRHSDIKKPYRCRHELITDVMMDIVQGCCFPLFCIEDDDVKPEEVAIHTNGKPRPTEEMRENIYDLLGALSVLESFLGACIIGEISIKRE